MSDSQKKPRTKPPRPIESFGPEIMALLLKGAISGFEIRTDYSTATRLRLRIHQLRAAMRASNHPQYELAAKVRVSIRNENPNEPTVKQGQHHVPLDRHCKTIVHLSPNDSEFGTLLKTVNIDPMSGVTDSPPLAQDPEPHSTPIHDLEDLLKEIQS